MLEQIPRYFKEIFYTNLLGLILQNDDDFLTWFIGNLNLKFAGSESYHVEFQAGTEMGTPDLIIRSPKFVLLIEGKMKPSLSKYQPGGYLKLIERTKLPGVLIFVAHSKHISDLRDLVEAKAHKVKIPIQFISWERIADEFKRTAGIISGKDSLRLMKSELAQLILQNDSRSQEKLPITEVEKMLYSSQELGGVMFKVLELLKGLQSHIQSTRPKLLGKFKFGKSASLNYLGFYCYMAKYTIWVGFAPELWKKYGQSPIWMSIYENGKDEVLPRMKKLGAIADKDWFGSLLALKISDIAQEKQVQEWMMIISKAIKNLK